MTDTIQAAAPAVPGEGGFVVRLDGFSGPLDLLLHLLREQQLEIADIPIAAIAEQFLKTIDVLGLNEAADYLEMAGRLLRLKVQMLLPRHGDGEGWEDPRAELVRRLLEYQQVKEIALWMEQGIERRARRLGRSYLQPGPEVPPPPLTFEMLELLQAVERVIGGIATPVMHRVVARPLNVEAATARIEALLRERPRISWLDSLGAKPTLTDVLSTLLALLEMARRGVVRIVQPAPFAPIVIASESTDPTH